MSFAVVNTPDELVEALRNVKALGPRVVNRHHYKGKPMPAPWIYIGRGTPLGNPFTKDQHGDAALEKYRTWLWDRIRHRDAEVLRELRRITSDTNLVCSCAPKPCHGDIVVRAWFWLQARERKRRAP